MEHSRRVVSSDRAGVSFLAMAAKIFKTLEELKALRKPMRNVFIEQREKLSNLDKLAVLTTKYVGSMGFFLIIFTWTVAWLTWNTIGPNGLRFDPYPAFVLWLFISNVIQIMLMPLIMLGQNLDSQHAEARAESDFQVNIKAEREIEVILQHLEGQNELMLQILQHLEDSKEDRKKEEEEKNKSGDKKT
jgi:uncharacterized membrane protein